MTDGGGGGGSGLDAVKIRMPWTSRRWPAIGSIGHRAKRRVLRHKKKRVRSDQNTTPTRVQKTPDWDYCKQTKKHDTYHREPTISWKWSESYRRDGPERGPATPNNDRSILGTNTSSHQRAPVTNLQHITRKNKNDGCCCTILAHLNPSPAPAPLQIPPAQTPTLEVGTIPPGSAARARFPRSRAATLRSCPVQHVLRSYMLVPSSSGTGRWRPQSRIERTDARRSEKCLLYQGRKVEIRQAINTKAINTISVIWYKFVFGDVPTPISTSSSSPVGPTPPEASDDSGEGGGGVVT